ncbi:MAG: hypothetical protein RL385_870 [Pseudomonadota bacterium]|jgi:HrpA-like RNA helicase
MAFELPIHAVRAAFDGALKRGPVVLSSPTGSGKSTEVPRFCPGRVLVVEPRRIACRSLASRIADNLGSALGEEVGYVVRDERVMGAATRILFATPGMVLRDHALLGAADTVILDEFHERSLDIDLLFALLAAERTKSLVVMSATLDGARIAQHLGGEHVTALGSAYPVVVHYVAGDEILPSSADLPRRVQDALAKAAGDAGDVLVFLPGKAEIEACASLLRGMPYTLLPLHGGLSLEEQRRVFLPASRRKLILATNVAETSLTIPGIGVVIDAGLVRQMRYQAGRGSLALVPVALDSATQRTGRAGRTAEGVCYRLWSASAKLEAQTLPELHRESLVPLVLAAAAWGKLPETLPFLDPPKAHALEAARADLAAWGALAEDGSLSKSGQGLFTLPVAPLHAQLLLRAEEAGAMEDMLDLVAVLSVGRPLFLSGRTVDGDGEDLAACCDATVLVTALRSASMTSAGVSSLTLAEARRERARLRRMHGLSANEAVPRPFDREAVIRAALRADPRVAHVARTRGRELSFSNGGTELALARESAAGIAKKLEALLVLDTRAFGTGRDARVLITCAMPVPLSTLARAGLGEEHIAAVQLEKKRVVCDLERVYAKRVLAERRDEPSGALLREALARLLERGSMFRDAVALSRERLSRSALAQALAAREKPGSAEAVPSFEAWLRQRLDTLGVEGPDDVALLSASDFTAPALPEEVRYSLDADYPASVDVGDATYRADYDVAQGQVILQMVKGNRREPPPAAYLPRFSGLRVYVSSPRGTVLVRQRSS